MSDSDSRLRSEVERQAQRISELENRVRALEQRSAAGPVVSAPAGVAAARPGETPARARRRRGPAWMTGLPARIGRTFVVLGGAFFIRALTENHVVPDAPGAAAGLAYAFVWLAMAERCARTRREDDGTAYGIAAAVIAFPLIWETTTRFGVMGPTVSASVLTVVAGLMLAVAWLREMRLLAWLVTIGSTATGVGLLFATHSLPIFALALFLIAAASLAASFHREWYGLRWPAAVALDLLVVLAMYLLGKPNYEWLRAQALANVQLLLVATYLGIIGVRTLVLSHPTREFGVVQSLVVLAVGFEGARRVLGSEHPWAPLFPPAALALAAASYGAAFLRFERDPEQRANWNWYLTLGTILAIYSGLLIVPGSEVGLWWALLAAGAAWLGLREGREALRWNALALTLAAGVGSRTLFAAFSALFAADLETWIDFPPAAWATAILFAGAWVQTRWIRGDARHPQPNDRRLPGLALLVTAAIGLGGGTVAELGPLVAGAVGGEPHAGILAVLRTAVILLASLGFAAMSRNRRLPELVWAAYGALAAAACKIVVDDLPNGTAMTTFVSFVFFGGAMIVAPRLVPDADEEGSD